MKDYGTRLKMNEDINVWFVKDWEQIRIVLALQNISSKAFSVIPIFDSMNKKSVVVDANTKD